MTFSAVFKTSTTTIAIVNNFTKHSLLPLKQQLQQHQQLFGWTKVRPKQNFEKGRERESMHHHFVIPNFSLLLGQKISIKNFKRKRISGVDIINNHKPILQPIVTYYDKLGIVCDLYNNNCSTMFIVTRLATQRILLFVNWSQFPNNISL